MDSRLYFKIKTQNGLIIRTMKQNPNTWFLAGDFCGGNSDCPFIGYKAPTRIIEMQKEGLIVSRWSDRKTALDKQMKEYKLNTEKFDFEVRSLYGDIKVKLKLQKKGEDQVALFDRENLSQCANA